jgi:hypothetical protein
MGTKVSGFGVEVDFGKHTKQDAPHAHKAAKYFYTKGQLGKVYRYRKDLADDVYFTLPALTHSCFGWVVAGDDNERAIFTVDNDGDATLIFNSTNVVANADTDGKLCIGTATTQEPLRIKNRLGATKFIDLVIFYN